MKKVSAKTIKAHSNKEATIFTFLNRIFSLPSKIFDFKNGGLLRTIIGWSLRLGSVALLSAVVKVDYDILAGLDSHMPASSFIGNIFSVLGISFTGYMGTGLLYLRASRILKEGVLSEYPMLFLFAEIVQIFSELLGAMIIILSSIVAILSAVFSAMGTDGAYGFAPLLSGLYGWASLYYFFGGIAFLLIGHAFREFLTILIRIEKNTR